jgi:glyoxylase-like metal-dependent hydrolase (beta-lactamase superfamily II)
MKTFVTILKWLGGIILVLGAVGFTLYMVYLRPFMNKMKQTATIQYDKELTLITGGGGNSGILCSDSLVIVIDTKMDDAAENLYKTVKGLAGSKPILVINTHDHPDHSGGNKLYKGSTIIAGGNYTPEGWTKDAGPESMPTVWLKTSMDIKMGDDTVTILNLGTNVHTASDIVVYLHKRKMLFTGDVILNKQAPVIMGVADPDAYVVAFDRLQKQFDIQKIVPGHGPVGGIEIIADFRQYFADMKTAAMDDSKASELKAKYKDWNQIPFVMSPGATISAFQKKMKHS